ncbi:MULTISPECIES: hypothetical protein [Pseudomonas syringae group]|uniref:hypothetical protein n=1 Tax=Pseudomonas syringae group TaxID=136849 RepID=UPI000F005FD3|nr:MULTISPECIES: hypothetical protein [Pseudomonas syringae group]QQN29844.1 hypothetical protein JHZ65_13130 [Pseudomonas syringae pv. maculicola]RMO83026.1 hypothetical protein ALQ34_102506 [Pseudomonas syringae pv. maculicola]
MSSAQVMPKALELRQATARSAAAGVCKPLPQVAATLKTRALQAQLPNTLSIRCCPDNSDDVLAVT